MMFTEFDLNKISNSTKNIRVMVIGDYCLDSYYFINSAHDFKSDHTRLDTFCTKTRRISPGGAGNVVKNFLSLGANVYAVGVVGNDGSGMELVGELRRLGADTSGLIVNDSINTPNYSRFIRDNVACNEILFLNQECLDEEIIKQLGDVCEERILSVDAVIVVEHFSGENASGLIELLHADIQKMSAENKDTVFLVDSKCRIQKYFNTYIKCNKHELIKSVLNIDTIDEAESNYVNFDRVKSCVSALAKEDTLFITMGEDGVLLFHEDTCKHIKSIPINQPIDTCGAGDSATVGIIIGIVLGLGHEKAAMLGNIISSITIKQLHCTGETDINALISEIGHLHYIPNFSVI